MKLNKILISLCLASILSLVAENSLKVETLKEIVSSDSTKKTATKKSDKNKAQKKVPKDSKTAPSKEKDKKKSVGHKKQELVQESNKVSANPTLEDPVLALCNKIVMRICPHHGGKDIIITSRMLTTRSLEGRTRTLEDLRDDFLVYDKAVNGYHIPPATREAEQHIEGLKNQYGLDQKAIENLFQESGLTYEEGVEQLVMFYTNRAFIGHLIGSKVLVTEDEIQKYHDEHSEVVPTSYKIEKAFLKKDEVPEEAINNLRKYGLGQDNIIWQPAYWIAEDDIADTKKFITKMYEGVVKVLDADTSWEIVRLVKKVETYTKPLEERYKEIVEKLQYQKYQEKLDQFKKDLLKEYVIVEVA